MVRFSFFCVERRRARLQWRQDTAAARWLEREMEGACTNDWLSLLTFQSASACLYRYKHANQTLGRPDIPWFVQWFLIRFNPKHVFCKKTVPKVDGIADDLTNFSNALKWKSVLKGSVDDRVLKYRMKQWKTPPCTAQVDPGLNAWIKKLRSCVLEACIDEVRKSRHSIRYSNVCPLVKRAIRWLKESNFYIHKNDK